MVAADLQVLADLLIHSTNSAFCYIPGISLNSPGITTPTMNYRKAFNIDDIAPTVLAVGVAAIVGAVVLLVLNGVQTSSSVTVNSLTYNALNNGSSGISNVFAQFPLLGTVIGLVLILGVVLYFFYGGRQTQDL